MSEKNSLINKLVSEKRDLQTELITCNTKIENQRRNISDQLNALSKKSKEIEILKGDVVAGDIMIKSQNEKIVHQEKVLKSLKQTTSDLKLKFSEAEKQNDHYISEICRVSNESKEKLLE